MIAAVAFVAGAVNVHAQGRAELDAAEAALDAGDFITSSELMATACGLGNMVGCHILGSFLMTDLIGPPDEVGARLAYEQSCFSGIQTSCEEAINLPMFDETVLSEAEAVAALEAGRAEERQVEARRLFRVACASENVEACYEYALMMSQGHGGPKDQASSRLYFRLGCQSGIAGSCWVYANQLDLGYGGAKDEAGAIIAFGDACLLGMAAGCHWVAPEMADAAAEGDQRALEILVKGCESGASLSCFELYGLYVDQRNPEAARVAAGLGCAASETGTDFQQGANCGSYASMLLNGHGGPVDLAGARAAFDTGCTLGFDPACERLAEMGP